LRNVSQRFPLLVGGPRVWRNVARQAFMGPPRLIMMSHTIRTHGDDFFVISLQQGCSLSYFGERKKEMNEGVTLIGPSPLPTPQKNYWIVRNAPFGLHQGDVSPGVSQMRITEH